MQMRLVKEVAMSINCLIIFDGLTLICRRVAYFVINNSYNASKSIEQRMIFLVDDRTRIMIVPLICCNISISCFSFVATMPLVRINFRFSLSKHHTF